MTARNFDVIVVGAGCAGATAALGLARAGFSVAMVEAAAYPGAENWSGCVYFCENLAHPDLLGPEGVEGLAWERRLVERGFFACDGNGLLGLTYRDPAAFRHCYTVLRPVFDHHLAQLAVRRGAVLMNNTTVESLIRDGGRVVGVCTNRGPLYADLVFLAEGDASHLVTREGYERFTDRAEKPRFLHGIKQVIELPPGAIEERFGVGPEEGVAYEMLLRNGRLRGRNVHLNMGGFVYTNRQSLSVGLVLPADNLHEHFAGDPNLLLEWFEDLPALRPWLEGGRRATFGAKIIRGGGARDIPTLIDAGLAVGGAASAVGIDFPYPNYTGPATAMGLLLAHAAVRIRAAGGQFTRENLRRFYLEPLERTHYWQDVEFLRRWPGYVKKTRTFFAQNLDLGLGSAYIWTRPRRWPLTRWVHWVRMLKQVFRPGEVQGLREDLGHLTRALRLKSILKPPSWGRLLLDGTVNALRDFFHHPRANLAPAGQVELRYWLPGGDGAGAGPPRWFQRWLGRLAPVVAAAARTVYTNDATPLGTRLRSAAQLLVRQVNLADLIRVGLVGLATGVTAAWLGGWDRLRGLFRRSGNRGAARGMFREYEKAAARATDLTPTQASAAQHWEARLGTLAYQTARSSHIHLLWPQKVAEKNDVVRAGLWHVCPAHVYEARVSPLGQLQVVVNFENCIKCETCWRTSTLVDWGRDGRQRFIYPVHSPAIARLIGALDNAAPSRPALSFSRGAWFLPLQEFSRRLDAEPIGLNGREAEALPDLERLLNVLERKLAEFDAALDEEPRTIDRARAAYLEMLARYAHQAAVRVVEILRGSFAGAFQDLLPLAGVLAARAEERLRRAQEGKFPWAAADGRQLRWHHLVGLRRYLAELQRRLLAPIPRPDPLRVWHQGEEPAAAAADTLTRLTALLDKAFPATAWRQLEHQTPLTDAQDKALREVLAAVPVLDPADLAGTMHPPPRKLLLAELGRRDPSLAYRAAAHLWARDLARLATIASPLTAQADRWARGEEWACFAVLEEGPEGKREGWLVPARGADALLLLVRDRLILLRGEVPGLAVEPLGTLGLRGAGLSRVEVEEKSLPEGTGVDPERVRRIWNVLASADLISIAHGMADQLCRRAVAHATSRVQFPGLFHDEQARDTIGKFGAVKKIIAEMATGRYVLQTLDHCLGPADFSGASAERAGLLKAVAAEILGTAPGSVSYNAGQVFGGTGYSEDDILAKFYRDAAAWRFLGPANPETFRKHGEKLLRHVRDNQRSGGLPGEPELFDEVAQRKALQAELDEVRVFRSRLRGLVAEWQPVQRLLSSADPAAAPWAGTGRAAEVAEQLGRQDARLLVSKALLLRTHARLEKGLPSEVETALLRIWLRRALGEIGDLEQQIKVPPPDDQPLPTPEAGPPVTRYADFLAAPLPYDSGNFLCRPVDLTQPRYVPEMNEADPELAGPAREIWSLLEQHFGPPRDGLPFERYIESRHRPDAADLDFCRRHGFFRMPIPRELGGEGRRKAEYYLLTTGAQRLADVATSLTIQANTSIGTTPVLLARDKDLPMAQKDLGPFVGDTGLQQEIQEKLQKLLALLEAPDPGKIEQAYRELQERLQTTVLARTVLRGLAHRFLDHWQQAGCSLLAFDLPGMAAHLREALPAWQEACARAPELHAELARRREACDLFLRWVAAGQISAFALTEPSAGSDTARVATRARLRSVPVEVEPDGVLRFVPEGAKEPRYLLDARRLEFRPDGAYYRWSDQSDPAPIHFEEYDYETDDPRGLRFYDHGPRRVHFNDVAQLRERDGRPWYDYYELTGAKMWITNGRMAGVMCLYAKTDEGVTGFIVDRHAEGLIVGKDEAKMGQCGSPTNELSLQAVRVPRENVLGLEGRGQVNALETLNVGRAGLAMSAMTQMPGLIESGRAFALATRGSVPDGAAWRLRRMEEECFIAESLAHDVIGKFEHPRTRSVRLESAASKMLVSELLHHVIETAEEIHGPAGQTTRHLVEKRKRDARILNIYEGTNEVQRFTILKDLAAEVAPRWRKSGVPASTQSLGREALELEAQKAGARRRIEAALDLLGQDLWQNPNLQVNCFLLAEVAAWLAAAECTLGRVAWLGRQQPVAGNKVQLGRRAFARCLYEVRKRLQQFDEELASLRDGLYAPEVRAADLLYNQTKAAEANPPLISRIERPLSVLVVIEPWAGAVPQPYVAEGRLLEPYLTLNEADRSALEMALRLREGAAAPVTITVASVGPRRAEPLLREALSLGADRARLLVTDTLGVTPDCAATALAHFLRDEGPFDLILGGSGAPGEEEGAVTCLTAEFLGVPHFGSAAGLAVEAKRGSGSVLLLGSDRPQRTRPLPAAVALEAGLPLREFTTEGFLAGLAKPVEIAGWPREVEARPVVFQEAAASTGPLVGEEEQPHPLRPEEAGQWVLHALGLESQGASSPTASAETIRDVEQPSFARQDEVLALVAADSAGRLRPGAEQVIRAARLASGSRSPVVALVVSGTEEVQRQTLAQVRAWHSGTVVLIVLPGAEAGVDGKAALLADSLRGLVVLPAVVVGESWTEPAFSRLGGRTSGADSIVLRAHSLGRAEGRLVLETRRARGKLRGRQTLQPRPGRTCWITLADDARVEGPKAARQEEAGAERWTPSLKDRYGKEDLERLLGDLKQEAGLVSLKDAQFIIDVGFGVGNRDGFEAVIEPLEQALRELGVRGLVVGGSRKVTEELHLLPADRQIGQSGVSVNPQVLLAIGISGAPQHLDYIGPRARILAFNRDPDAPLLTLNRRQPLPKVYPVIGDLFETVPALVAILRREKSREQSEAE